jgi:hypothetical protein
MRFFDIVLLATNYDEIFIKMVQSDLEGQINLDTYNYIQ